MIVATQIALVIIRCIIIPSVNTSYVYDLFYILIYISVVFLEMAICVFITFSELIYIQVGLLAPWNCCSTLLE